MSYAEFATNSRYIQCEDALKEFKRYVHGMGTNFLIVTACGAITKEVVDTITESFNSTMESKADPVLLQNNFKYAAEIQRAKTYDAENSSLRYTFLDFEGQQCNQNNINYLVKKAEECEADVVVGIGGGKGLDLARAVALYHSCKVVLVPTSPATNASGSSLVVLYDNEGKVDHTVSMPFFPDLVLADLSILINAPWQMFVAGIGDAIGTSIETEGFWVAMGQQNQILDGSWYGNKIMQKVIFENGRSAVEAAQQKTINHAYESIMPYILNACGSQRYFRSLFIPHFIDKFILSFDGPKKLQHGERVGYGVIPQMVYEKRTLAELHQYIAFCLDIGIPVTLEELGLNTVSEKELWDAADVFIEENKTVKAHVFPFDAEMFVVNLLEGEKIVQAYLTERQ